MNDIRYDDEGLAEFRRRVAAIWGGVEIFIHPQTDEEKAERRIRLTIERPYNIIISFDLAGRKA